MKEVISRQIFSLSAVATPNAAKIKVVLVKIK